MSELGLWPPWEANVSTNAQCLCAVLPPPPPRSSFSIKTVFQSSLSTSLFSTLFGEGYFGEVARLLCPSRYSISGSPRHLVGSSELCLCQDSLRVAHMVRARQLHVHPPSSTHAQLPVLRLGGQTLLCTLLSLTPGLRFPERLFSHRKMHFKCIHIVARSNSLVPFCCWVVFCCVGVPQFIHSHWAFPVWGNGELNCCKHSHTRFWMNISFLFSWVLITGGIAGPYGRYMFNFMKIAKWLYRFAFLPTTYKVPVTLHPCQHLVL